MRLAIVARCASWAIRLPFVAAILIGTGLLIVEAIVMLSEGEWLGLLVLGVAVVEVAMLPAMTVALIGPACSSGAADAELHVPRKL